MTNSKDAPVTRYITWVAEYMTNKFNGTPIDVNAYYITININSLAKKQELDGAGWTRLILFSDTIEKEYEVEWWKLGEYQWSVIEKYKPNLKEWINEHKDQYLLMRETNGDY